MKNNTKKLCISISVLLISALLLASITACDSNEISQDEISQSDAFPLDESIVFTINDNILNASYLNSTPVDDSIIVYTRDYRLNDSASVIIGCKQYDRASISVVPEDDENYYIQLITKESIENTVIPVNGFVLSVPLKMISEMNIRLGQQVVFSQTSFLPPTERMDKGYFYPDLSERLLVRRRVSYIDPINGVQKDGIYFLSAEYTSKSVELPRECVIVTLSNVTKNSFRVSNVLHKTVASSSVDQLIFVGDYNCAYAEAIMKEELKLTFRDLELVSSISDSEAIIIDNNIYQFSAENYNVAKINQSGVYCFDNKYAYVSTPESDVDRIDIIVINNKVMYIGKENKRNMMPLSGGLAITFAGDSIAAVQDLKVGDNAETVMLDSTLLPLNHVFINGIAFEYTKMNTVRAPEGVTALYTSEFGLTTQTNQYGIEIAVSDGQVIAIEKNIGNIDIPANGFVLSIHKDSAMYNDAMTKISLGDAASLSSGKRNYSAVDLKVTGINETRVQDALIVYRNVSSTSTNAYGYEILIDENGYMVGDSYSGNSIVPKNGFVLSGHGINKDALISAYRYGGKVYFNDKTMTVTLISTPDNLLTEAAFRMDDIRNAIENAKAQLLYLNYTELDATVASLKKMLMNAENAFSDGNYEKALADLTVIDSNWDDLHYAIIESHPVENRAMWYRSFEKSDEEVRAVVEKMKSLNINAIYLETWYNGRFIGFSEQELIEHSAYNADYDALEGFVRICHESGIEVHAWVENFFIGTVEAQEQANQALSSHFEGRWLKDRKGRNTYFYTASNTNFIFMNPYDEEVRKLLIDFYKEMITKYDIDGLHLDYIRFPELNYGTDDFGYNEDIITAWQKENNTNVNPATLSGGSLHQSWIKFRQEIINSFVKEVYEMICTTDPSIWLSAAVYPGVPNIKNDIFQDCTDWVKNEYVDELFSMSYGEDNSYVRDNASKFVSIAKNNCFYSTGISAFGETTELNFGLQMTEVRKAGADGVSIFSLANVNVSNYQSPIQNGAFRLQSVQTNQLNKTVSAQLSYICDKAKTVYIPYAGLSAENYQSLYELLEPIITAADAFDAEQASLEDKILYCNTVKSSIDEIKSLLEDYISDSKDLKIVLSDFEILESWLTKSEARLNARLH